ncbi:RRM 1 domain containing protein [Trichuris trichiura]|uniref:RRM 1 domain containing protein n=1 Tax=Trichuris trichiura TaxID=36087 RepID=A0A077YYR1_TRITR|nr:RRM 1 domain containing protein [Trichuris trichiura]
MLPYTMHFLAHEIREYDVEDFFKGYGKIRDINLKQGYGFVEFDDHRDASDAVHDLNGKHLLDGSRSRSFHGSTRHGWRRIPRSRQRSWLVQLSSAFAF